MIPAKAWAHENPTAAELGKFCAEMWRTKLSQETRELFFALAVLPPPLRIAHNLRILAELVPYVTEWQDILREGLTDRERLALCELDATQLSVRAKEIAHGLLNLHSRWRVMQTLKGAFVDAQRQRRQFLGSAQLEDVL